MNVGNSVRLAVRDFADEIDSSMLHACNAVDGTAAKMYPPTLGSQKCLTRLLRDNYAVIEAMSLGGVNLDETRFPVPVRRVTTGDGHPDMADVIYSIHRCSHGRGDELPDGFDLVPSENAPGHVSVLIEKGKLRLTDKLIWGLLAVAVLEPVNVGQAAPGYSLALLDHEIVIDEWWGRGDDFRMLAAQHPMPRVKLDFTDWMLDY